VTFTRIGRDNPSQILTVAYSIQAFTANLIAPPDYEPASGTLTFADHQNNATFSDAILNDDILESLNQHFTLSLSDIRYNGITVCSTHMGANTNMTATILDDGDAGSSSFTPSQVSIPEVYGANSTLVLTVTRLGRPVPSGELTVLYSTMDGTATGDLDYGIVTQKKLVLTDGALTSIFNITIIDDDLSEYPNEEFTFVLSDLRFMGQSYLVNGTLVTHIFAVTRTGRTIPSKQISVAYTLVGIPTTAEMDYVSMNSSITFASLQHSANDGIVLSPSPLPKTPFSPHYIK
jgi:hypothetical protein